jgi:exopolyphosphatase/guanosine-5'-triphosphate,3'-diphosphate pyrophosphatase
MRIAVIDLGTNTFNLVIADHNKSYYTIIHQDKFPVKLGEGRHQSKHHTTRAILERYR